MFLKVLNEGYNMNEGSAVINGEYEGEAGAYRLLAESNEEWANLTMAMANCEVAAYLEADLSTLKNGVTGFIDRAIEMFQKMWAGIQSLFNKFVTWLKAITSNDEQFLKKYKTELSGIKAKVRSDFDYKLMPFTLESIKKFSEGFSKVQSVATLSKGFDDTTEEEDKGAKLSSQKLFIESLSETSSFREAALKVMCNGSDPELRVYKASEIPWAELVTVITDYKKTLKEAQSGKEDIGLAFKGTFRYLNNVKAEMKRSSNEETQEKSKNISKVIKNAKILHSVSNEAYGIMVESLKKHRSQARGCLTKALVSISGNNKNSASKKEQTSRENGMAIAATNESYNFLDNFMDM